MAAPELLETRPAFRGLAWLVAASAGVTSALLWDFSWESTIGIDLPWAAPHLALDAAALAAAIGALLALGQRIGVAIGPVRAPLGAWIALWGSAAFLVATLFDHWWQSTYGLSAGIWHPPQLLKAGAFLAITGGAWIASAGRSLLFPLAGGMLLSLAGAMTVTNLYANRQHGAGFYQLGCALYPSVLVALAVAGPRRFSASLGALAACGLGLAAVWLLPLIPGSPQVAPIHQPRDFLLPPPFPLLLVVPAFMIDLLVRVSPGVAGPENSPRRAIEAGCAFFAVFLAVQWNFAGFLLSPVADNPLFAGGGRHWPFFLKLDAAAHTAFWRLPGDDVDLTAGLACAAAAIASSAAGFAIGHWLNRVRR